MEAGPEIGIHLILATQVPSSYREGPKEMRDEKKAEMFEANFDKYAAKAGVLPKIDTL